MDLITTIREMLHQSFAISIIGFCSIIAIVFAVEFLKRSFSR